MVLLTGNAILRGMKDVDGSLWWMVDVGRGFPADQLRWCEDDLGPRGDHHRWPKWISNRAGTAGLFMFRDLKAAMWMEMVWP